MASTQLFTPGLDTLLSTWVLRKNNIQVDSRIYFDLQGKYNENELEFLKTWYNENFFDVANILNITPFEDKTTAHVPNRNLLLLTLAQSLYNSDIIYLNGNLEDRVSDNCQTFYSMAELILGTCAGKPVRVISPLIEKEKTEWCELYSKDEENDKFNLLTGTYSCFDSNWMHHDVPVFEYDKDKNSYNHVGNSCVFGCLNCPACVRKAHALTGANIFYPIIGKKLSDEYSTKVDSNIHPSRYNAIQEYNSFMSQLNFDWGIDDGSD